MCTLRTNLNRNTFKKTSKLKPDRLDKLFSTVTANACPHDRRKGMMRYHTCFSTVNKPWIDLSDDNIAIRMSNRYFMHMNRLVFMTIKVFHVNLRETFT